MTHPSNQNSPKSEYSEFLIARLSFYLNANIQENKKKRPIVIVTEPGMGTIAAVKEACNSVAQAQGVNLSLGNQAGPRDIIFTEASNHSGLYSGNHFVNMPGLPSKLETNVDLARVSPTNSLVVVVDGKSVSDSHVKEILSDLLNPAKVNGLEPSILFTLSPEQFAAHEIMIKNNFIVIENLPPVSQLSGASVAQRREKSQNPSEPKGLQL